MTKTHFCINAFAMVFLLPFLAFCCLAWWDEEGWI